MVSRLQARPPARSVSVASGLERLQATNDGLVVTKSRLREPAPVRNGARARRAQRRGGALGVLLILALVVGCTVLAGARNYPLRLRLSLLGRERPRERLIALVSDLDRESCRDTSDRITTCTEAAVWVSYYKRFVLPPLTLGKLTIEPPRFIDKIRLEVREQPERSVRGMELSELVLHDGHLLAPDDRGVLYEILSPRGALPKEHTSFIPHVGSAVQPAPLRRGLLHDGDGSQGAFKGEWAVVKDGELIIGGHGRPVTDGGSFVRSAGPLWVKSIADDFTVTHTNWTSMYAALNRAAGVRFPGYLMHEAALWSSLRREWIFLPRRRSEMPYDEVSNTRRGWNAALIADEHFSDVRVRYIPGLHDAEGFRGFSSAKFLPGSGDEIVVALRTVEIDAGNYGYKSRYTATFISAFSIISGELIMKEIRVAAREKFEGLVFL